MVATCGNAAMEKVNGAESKENSGKEVDAEALDFQVEGGKLLWLKQLGSGNYGAVHMVRCMPEDRLYALKISNGSRTAEELMHELQMLQGLMHANILPAYSLVSSVASLGMLVELGSMSLWHYLRSSDPTTVLQWKVALQASKAVAFLHRKFIIHCDLKPGNMIMFPDGILKIADFGLAQKVEKAGRPVYIMGNHVCTANYRPPECMAAGRRQARHQMKAPKTTIYITEDVC